MELQTSNFKIQNKSQAITSKAFWFKGLDLFGSWKFEVWILIWLLVLGFWSLPASALSLKDWKDSLYHGIKAEAERSFSDLFRRKVTIREAGGPVIGQIVLKNVSIPDLGQVPKIILSFNPLKYVYHKGDIIPALTKITLIDGNFDVYRDKKGRWNILSLLPPGEKEAAVPPPFRGLLNFKNCRVSYLDVRGFRKVPQLFSVEVLKVNGTADLRKKDQMKFALSGEVPNPIKLEGFLDLKTGKYLLDLSTEKLDLEKWGNYTVPLPDLKFLEGKADLLLKVLPPKTKGWPVALVGKITFREAGARYQTYKLSKTSGDLFIADENLNFSNLKTEINLIPLIINGRFYDFTRRNLDLTVSVSEGMPYQQKFSGTAHLISKNNILTAEATFSNLFRGTFLTEVQLNLSKREPELNLKTKFSKLDLASLAQEAPGIEGLAEGSLELSGPLSNLAGEFSADLSKALAFGQPMQNLLASFHVRNGDFYLGSFQAASPTAVFSSQGKIGRDLSFDLQAEASGLRISGKGILGKMQALVNKFRGTIRGKLDQKLLTSPLRNLFASGEVVLSEGQIGEQLFDQAQGKIEIGGGRIQIADALIQKESSVLRAAGQTGLGYPTQLKISGENLNLEDFKILNHFLPPEAKNPRGRATFEVEVTGMLSQETLITSIDPLLDLTARGKLSLINSSVAGVPLLETSINFAWQERGLSIPDCQIKMPDSTLTLSLESRKDGAINGSLIGTADLSLFHFLTAKYGKLSGRVGVNLNLGGEMKEPTLAASFWINQFLFNEVYFDSISGSFSYERGRLTLLDPFLFRSGRDLYTLSGNATLPSENPGESMVDLELKVLQADLASFYRLFGKLQGEFLRRFSLPTEGKTAINLQNLILSPWTDRDRIPLYLANGEKNYFLKTWNTIRLDFEKTLAAAPEENLGGNLLGDFKLQGKVQNPSGKFSIRITNGYFRTFSFDDFSASASLKNQEIKIEKAVLSKDKGNITARGDYHLNGNLSLHVVANDMSLDILQIIFPKKEFKGIFSMNAGFDGPLQNLRISLAAAGKDVTLAGIDFDKVSLSITKKDNHLYLHEFSLLQQNLLSSAYGSIFISHPGQINLEATLKGNAVGLLNLLTEDVKWRSGKSSVSAKIQGTFEDPKINGKASVTEGILYVRALDSEIRNLQGEATIKDNLLIIKSLTAIWAGEKTRDWPNFLGLAGTIDLSKILAEKSEVYLNLAFSPTRLYLAFPNFYTGGLQLEELFLQGPFSFDFSQGPLLKGKVAADNAILTLSQIAPGGKVFPLNFDLEVDLTKNVYAVMGNILALDLSYIFMNLEIAGEGERITGSIEAPILLGKIFIKRGTINIFNREFTLLSPEMQKKFFPYDPEKVKENIAIFRGEKGPAGVLPEIYLTSSTNIEVIEKDVKKKVTVLARLQGTIGASEKERGLQILLWGFTEDKTKIPPEMIPAAYSEQDLKVMLLPDILKLALRIEQPEEIAKMEPEAVKAALTDFLASQAQSFLFRGIEREVEKTLGLESLTLEYNLGPKVREALGVKEVKGFEEKKPAWTVGFVKGITDRLYVDVRYAQGMEQTAGTAAETTFNYQLTYKINPIWSIIYYREPVSLTELTTGYQKVTLKAGFSLW